MFFFCKLMTAYDMRISDWSSDVFSSDLQTVPRGAIERLARALSDHALLVVDEAYVEFADDGSIADLIDRYDNLAVLRTLSKAWALAGARIGSLLANADVVALLRKIMAPYPLPLPCVRSEAHTSELQSLMRITY